MSTFKLDTDLTIVNEKQGTEDMTKKIRIFKNLEYILMFHQEDQPK